MKVERRAPGPAYANLQWRCYGADVGEDIASVDVDVNRWSTPHAEVERPEPIPYASQTGSHADRRDGATANLDSFCARQRQARCRSGRRNELSDRTKKLTKEKRCADLSPIETPP